MLICYKNCPLREQCVRKITIFATTNHQKEDCLCQLKPKLRKRIWRSTNSWSSRVPPSKYHPFGITDKHQSAAWVSRFFWAQSGKRCEHSLLAPHVSIDHLIYGDFVSNSVPCRTWRRGRWGWQLPQRRWSARSTWWFPFSSYALMFNLYCLMFSLSADRAVPEGG